MNTSQCKKVDSTWKHHVLGKMGVVRTAPKEIIFAPIQYGGIGLHSTYVDQLIDHVKMLLHHGHTTSITGKLIRNSLQQMVIEMGLPGCPFKMDLNKIEYLTENTWVENTLRACQQHNVHIDTNEKWLHQWIDTDDFIMKRAILLLSKKGASLMNKVRMYLGVVTLSDIMVADSKSIDKEILSGKRGSSPSPSRHAYRWPNVPPPTPAEIANWRITILLLYDITETDTTLKSHHWRWFKYASRTHTAWNLSMTNGSIYQKEENEWRIWDREESANRSSRRAGCTYTATDIRCPNLGDGAYAPISVHFTGENTIKIVSRGRYDVPPLGNNAVEAPWYLPATSTVGEEEAQLYVQKISQGEGSAVCDGSYKQGRSTATFVVQHEKMSQEEARQKRHHQSVTVPGHPIDQSSYRGELGGILSTIAYTNELCKRTGTEGTCTLACDNIGALSASFGWKTPNPNWKSFDIVSMIRHQLRISSIQWNHRHVKGHQDDQDKFLDLDAASQANVIADENAKEEWKKNYSPSKNRTAGQPWTITCQGTVLTGNVENRLRHELYETPLKKWWMKKCNLESCEENLIDWDAYYSFRKLTPKWRNVWAVKYGAGLLPTGQNLERRGHRDNPSCPWCSEEVETTEHLFQCSHEEMSKCFADEVDKIDDFLRATTSQEIREAIIQLLQGLRSGEIELPDEPTGVSTTMEEQFDLGQKATLNGMWLKSWTSHQSEYLKAIGSRKRAKVWVAQLALHLHEMVHAIWKARNEAIHKKETSAFNKEKNCELDQKIDELYTGLPQLRLFRPSDRAIFKRENQTIQNN